MMKVTQRLLVGLLMSAAAAMGAISMKAQTRTFNVVEVPIQELQDALTRGHVTSRELVQAYLDRINRYEGLLNAYITLNPRALEEADRLDRERAAGLVRSPLHGIPIAVKDNINTNDMPTTGGALAFGGFVPPYDATLVAALRRAGAIIIAKTVLTEYANWIGDNVPANYSAFGGYGLNPYDPRPDPRPATNDGRPALGTGGSSSGIGTAASFWAANVGTETSGSILSPASANMLAGIKPTVGRISRWGILPITADQDIAGPMGRTVTDVAILMGILEEVDPRDASTTTCMAPPQRDYTRFLRLAGLSGKRIGIPRAQYYTPTINPRTGANSGGLNAAQLAVMNEAIDVMRANGATIVDPANIPSIVDGTVANNLLAYGTCTNTRAVDVEGLCSVVLKYGFKRDVNEYFATLGPTSPIKTLTELRAFNTANAPRNAIRYGQRLFDISDEQDLVADKARYERDRAKDIYLTATHGIGEAMDVNRLDALVFPANIGANIAARPGFPSVIVPFGMVPNAPTPAFPEGFNARPAPFGVTFTGRPCSEPVLLEIGYAFEQATRRRVPPPNLP